MIGTLHSSLSGQIPTYSFQRQNHQNVVMQSPLSVDVSRLYHAQIAVMQLSWLHKLLFVLNDWKGNMHWLLRKALFLTLWSTSVKGGQDMSPKFANITSLMRESLLVWNQHKVLFVYLTSRMTHILKRKQHYQAAKSCWSAMSNDNVLC